MFEGVYTEMILNHPEIFPSPLSPQATGGVILGSQAVYRYSLKDSDYPSLIITDEIVNEEGNIILPGHYELALSDEWDFLIILQTKKPIAIVPVFKVEEDKNAEEKKKDKEYQKIIKKREKEREKTNRKRAEKGMPLDEEKIHMEATIEYMHEGDYYLIKYERGTIRAWGAIRG